MYKFQKFAIKNTINSLDIGHFEYYYSFMVLNEINYRRYILFLCLSIYFNCKLENFGFKIKKFLSESIEII